MNDNDYTARHGQRPYKIVSHGTNDKTLSYDFLVGNTDVVDLDIAAERRETLEMWLCIVIAIVAGCLTSIYCWSFYQ